jgi:beta-N-acetylhexosaminidase
MSACILGCSGPVLTRWEREFFADARPWGFILFGRNVETPDQLRRLAADLRQAVGVSCPVGVDQEGGRVQRLGPPHWTAYPPARTYRALGGAARETARLAGRLIASDLAEVGLDFTCAPVLDVPDPAGHAVIGDRAFSDDAHEAARLGRAFAEGLIAGGVMPVIKHAPGHGRAVVDSHAELPVVEASLVELVARDLIPFQALSDMPAAMTAHVVFTAIDRKRPATTSRKVIRKVVRGLAGFDGLLLSDDLSMGALQGDLRERAEAARDAGCDIALHCNGDGAEMKAVVAGAGALKGGSARRAQSALARLPRRPEPLDLTEGRARFAAAFAGRWAA